MPTLLRRLVHNIVHELGTGRAIENARRERDEYARAMAAVDVLEWMLAPIADETVAA